MLKLSWKNLINKPLNMALSLILFALGVGLVSLLVNLNHQVEENFDKNLAGVDLVLGAKGSPLQMILCAMYHVDNPTGNIPIEKARAFLNPKHPLIKQAVPLSLGDSYRGYRIVGTTYDILQFYNATIAEGKLWANPMEVTVGAAVADAQHLHIGDKFKSSHGLVEGIEEHEHDFTVVGILKPSGSVIDQLVLTPSESIWESHAHASDSSAVRQLAVGSQDTTTAEVHEHEHEHTKVAPTTYDSLTISQLAQQQRLELMEKTDKDITAILIRFRSRTNIQALNMARNINENTELMAASPPNEIARLQTNLGLGADTLKMLAWVIVIVSGLSIFISLFSSLRDRRYELALMRVMGGSRGTLFQLVILEGLLLAVMGYVLGIVLSHFSLGILAGFMKSTYRYSFSGWKFLPEEGWLFVGALAVGFVAALIPALQARRTDISETLAQG
ncbi:MAG: ABC transporter permease [Saprospiraceae bacterium]|nr:ABC transporter permease [Saprospiraceae bacterium]MCF8251442.1 ABC transporter permease [Saprospiraceae bacterium]MCF8282570.1 ABC transporter permease [Bacteroidales bacterium]MCF8313037.1 ABC transporter permease [Saprospiraceae bacterium]MCF8441484.1 ABC transporter permease [Saprospiraceae bacterium]